MSGPTTEQPAAALPPRSVGRLIRFILTVGVILILLHGYIGWRLLPNLAVGAAGWAAGVALLAASTLLIPLGMLARFFIQRQWLADRITWAGALVMGLFSSVLVLTLLRDVALLLSGSHTFASVTALLVPTLAVLMTLVGFINARRVPRVVEVDIPLTNLPLPLVGFTIVQLSDIHVSSTIRADYVRAIVERVNTLGADLVAITGDVVDGSVRQLADHTRPLGKLASRYGTFFVTGNHEYYSGAAEWVAEFRRLGLHCLMNEHVVLDHNGTQLVVAGITDFTAHQFDPTQRSNPAAALGNAPEGATKLLLAHQPRSAHAAAEAGFDLQLSGHTHGGQFWPWNYFVRLQQPYTAGLHRLDKLWVYTSRGTGYWGPPKRFGAPSEITLLRLIQA